MPVTVQTAVSGPFTPNGVTTVFAFTFKADSASEVIVVDEDGVALSTALYSVTMNVGEGGKVTFTTAPQLADYAEIYIVGNPAMTQSSDFGNAGPSFDPAAITRAFDRAAIRDIFIKDRVDRSIKVPFGDIGVTMPSATTRAGKFLSFAADGLPVASAGTGADAGLRTDMAASGGSALTGFLQAGTGAVARTAQAKMREVAFSPRDFGALGNGTGDDTASVNTLLGLMTGPGATGQYRTDWPYGGYNITQIRLDVSGSHHKFDHAILTGIATSGAPKKSCVDIRAGNQWINGLKAYGSFLASAVYESGVHHYTNNLTLYNPTATDNNDMHVEAFDLGLCIGALPSQGTADPSQAATLADDLAINAPLSELTYTNPKIMSCPKGILMSQPNGKVTMFGARAHSECNDWETYFTAGSYTALAADTYCVKVADPGSELTLIGGTLEHVQGGDNGACAIVTTGRLNIVDMVVETTVPHLMSGAGEMVIARAANNGLNSSTRAYLEVVTGATGRLSISDCQILWPENVHGTSAAVVTAVASLKGANGIAADFEADFRNVQLKGAPFSLTGATYRPLTRGVRSRFRDCLVIAYNGAGTGTETYRYRLNEGSNLLTVAADTSGGSLPSDGANGATTVGGWTSSFTGGYSWGQVTTSLPTVKGETISYAIHLAASAGANNVELVSGAFPCKPGEMNLLRGFIKTGATAGVIKLIAKFLKFDGTTAASTANLEMFNGAESQFGATWQPFVLACVPPADAVKMKIDLYVENGANLYVTGLSVT